MQRQQGKLEGHVAVITGGASGIGASTAELFIAEGARVVIGDLQPNAGRSLAEKLGDQCVFAPCNVADEGDVTSLIGTAVERWGRVDVLFNNAGFPGAIGPIETISSTDFDLSVGVLLKGPFLGMKHVAPIMKAQGSGSIISTASMAGHQAGYGGHLYSVTKAALLHLTRTVSLELAEQNVRVNSISPGMVATPLAAASPLDAAGPERAEAKMQRLRDGGANAQPLPRIGEAIDIARAALFLASADSEWITGVDLVVDGGFNAGRAWRRQPEWMTAASPMRLYRPAD